jgi:hypothetical protein
MKRREFITLLAARLRRGRSQRAGQPAMPVIGSLNGTSPEGYG